MEFTLGVCEIINIIDAIFVIANVIFFFVKKTKFKLLTKPVRFCILKMMLVADIFLLPIEIYFDKVVTYNVTMALMEITCVMALILMHTLDKNAE